MGKRYKRRYRVNRDKYSVETTCVRLSTGTSILNNLYQDGQLIVPSSATQGMRKVKHLTVSLASSSTRAVIFALVFVPQGYAVNALDGVVGHSLYEPNQFVMCTGCIDPDAGPIRIRCPLSRNLNSGDSIYLVCGTTEPSINLIGTVQYAVTLQ